MRGRALRILLTEDNSDHVELMRRYIFRMRPPPAALRCVARLDETIAALREEAFDVLLLDLRLPDSGLEQTLPRMIAAAPDLPIVVLTSLEDFEFAVEAVKLGAQDCLVKAHVNSDLMSRALHYAIERKQAQSELRHYAAELERANRELDQFTRVVSHDLKSPLASIEMSLQALADCGGASTPEHAERVQDALRTARQMREMVDALLRYARTGEQGAELEQVDCDELLQSVLAELRPAIEPSQAQITADPLPTVCGDRTRMAQLIRNLLENALKYHGQSPPQIHVSADFHGRDWVFTIQDHGIGIKPADRQRVFDMFARLHPDISSGSGVGLAICKRVVESHGGRIWVDDTPGGGSTFTFTWPARRDVPTGQPRGTDAAKPASAGPVEEATTH